MKNYTWMIGTILFCATIVTGCASTHSGPSSTNASSQNQANSAAVPSVEPTNTTLANTSTSGSTANGGGGASTGSGTGSVPPNSAVSGASLVRESMSKALHGSAVDVPFAVGTNIDAVQKAWGQPSQQDAAGAGIYETYHYHSAAFGLNKGDQIFDVRSYSPTLRALTLSEITSVMGTPGEVRDSGDSLIYMYPAGANYQLLWVFPKMKSGQPAPKLDHVSVFWPQGTVNLMAENQPAPGVMMDNGPGTVGSLFTFSISNPPKGYRLVELEWVPNGGTAVINTLTRATANGRNGNQTSGFSVSPDGNTLSFLYTSNMRNQTGHVQLIYQATSGAAMIGQSKSVTLK